MSVWDSRPVRDMGTIVGKNGGKLSCRLDLARSWGFQ